jgi:DNA-binding CsgD family transcriptional regulator
MPVAMAQPERRGPQVLNIGEVLALLSRGFSNREIAESLFVSEHTVRTHVQNLRSKLNVRSKFQAAMLAMQASPQNETATIRL